jgi:Protein of unknown function (DUF2946).
VRTIRIWLLLLLAVLLPVRGAVAAAMHCPVAASGSQVELHLQHDELPSAHHSMDEAMGAADHLSHDHAGAQQGHHGEQHNHGDGGQPDKCNLCSAFCSMPPIAGTPSTIFTPVEAANTAFPTLSAPAPSFLSDGQERPPRSI